LLKPSGSVKYGYSTPFGTYEVFLNQAVFFIGHDYWFGPLEIQSLTFLGRHFLQKEKN
jgi:hypothetical protein